MLVVALDQEPVAHEPRERLRVCGDVGRGISGPGFLDPAASAPWTRDGFGAVSQAAGRGRVDRGHKRTYILLKREKEPP